jgi:serine/threonine protein kinase
LNSEGKVKIGDFGLARHHCSPNREMSCRVVTLQYRAPELLFDSPFYGEAIDVWSVGVILGELFLPRGQVMFNGTCEID